MHSYDRNLGARDAFRRGFQEGRRDAQRGTVRQLCVTGSGAEPPVVKREDASYYHGYKYGAEQRGNVEGAWIQFKSKHRGKPAVLAANPRTPGGAHYVHGYNDVDATTSVWVSGGVPTSVQTQNPNETEVAAAISSWWGRKVYLSHWYDSGVDYKADVSIDPLARNPEQDLAANRRLGLGEGRVDGSATESLRHAKLRARSRGDIESALLSAGYYAKKRGETMYVYPGTSYGVGVWRVSARPSEYLDPINNSGPLTYSVSPDLTVTEHQVEGAYGSGLEPNRAQWGKSWGFFVTARGRRVEMQRKGQRVRFFDDRGRQVGPEQSNVAPAIAYALSMGWHDPDLYGPNPDRQRGWQLKADFGLYHHKNPVPPGGPAREAYQYMVTEVTEYTDPLTGEVDYTRLAEAGAISVDHDEWLDDPDHAIWDWAIEIGDQYAANARPARPTGEYSSRNFERRVHLFRDRGHPMDMANSLALAEQWMRQRDWDYTYAEDGEYPDQHLTVEVTLLDESGEPFDSMPGVPNADADILEAATMMAAVEMDK